MAAANNYAFGLGKFAYAVLVSSIGQKKVGRVAFFTNNNRK